MSATAIPSPDGRYVDVFVPIKFQRVGGRKMIVAPNGSRVGPEMSKDANTTIIKALSRASRWQKLLEDGVHATITDLAQAERINRSYVSRTMRLAPLAPDIAVALLDGTQPPTLRLTSFARTESGMTRAEILDIGLASFEMNSATAAPIGSTRCRAEVCVGRCFLVSLSFTSLRRTGGDIGQYDLSLRVRLQSFQHEMSLTCVGEGQNCANPTSELSIVDEPGNLCQSLCRHLD